jgi:hypothetical protein
MTPIERLTSIWQGVRNETPTTEQLQRLVVNFLPLLALPGETIADVRALPNGQIILRLIARLQAEWRGLLAAGTEAVERDAEPERRRQAVIAALLDL